MVHYVIALPCEAQPIIQHYALKPCGGHGRARFFEGENARLVVTGISSLQSAIATTALGNRFPESGSLWLNVGICGHADAAIGKAFIANRIASDNSRGTFYPQLPWSSPWSGIGIKTLSVPSTRYEADQVFDMEGFGFYTAALVFGSSELVQCVKIVSDNAAQPADGDFDNAAISNLVAAQIPSIETFVETVEKSSGKPDASEWASEFKRMAKSRYSFTETESHQLASRVRQLDALLESDEKAVLGGLSSRTSKKEFLKELQCLIDRHSALNVCDQPDEENAQISTNRKGRAVYP